MIRLIRSRLNRRRWARRIWQRVLADTAREILAADLRQAQRHHRPTRDIERKLRAATNEALRKGLGR